MPRIVRKLFHWSISVNRRDCRRGYPAKQLESLRVHCKTGGMPLMAMDGSTGAILRAPGKSRRICGSRSWSDSVGRMCAISA